MSSNIQNYFGAIGNWFGAWGFIFKNNLAHFFLYPLCISILLSMGAIVLIKQGVSYVMGFVTPRIQYESVDGSFWEMVKSVTSNVGEYATAFVLFLVSWYLFSRIQKYIVLAIMSPVMSIISDRTYRILTGSETAFNLGQFIMDVFRGVVLAVRNMLMEFLLSFVLWLLCVYLSLALPVVAVILTPLTIIISFMISAYYFGFATFDYSLERRKEGVRDSINLIRKNKASVLGNGTMFLLLFSIPYLGVTIGTIVCTVAATITVHEKKI